MGKSADTLISDIASTVAFYEQGSPSDRDLRELHKVAEATLSILVTIRQHQLDRSAVPGDLSEYAPVEEGF